MSAGLKSVMVTLPVWPSCGVNVSELVRNVERSACLERPHQSPLEPIASGAENDLVHLPRALAALDLRVGQQSALEQPTSRQHQRGKGLAGEEFIGLLAVALVEAGSGHSPDAWIFVFVHVDWIDDVLCGREGTFQVLLCCKLEVRKSSFRR